MPQQPWSARFDHPQLSIKQSVGSPPSMVNESAVPVTATLSFTSVNPNVQKAIQELITLIVTTAPIWIPLLVADPPSPTSGVIPGGAAQ